MTLADAIVEIERLRLIATLAASAAIGGAVALWRFGQRVDAERLRGCKECSHCRAEYSRWEKIREDRREQQLRDNLKSLGLSDAEIEERIRRSKGDR